MYLNGIDVSVWNGEIDWEKVRQSGIRFAMLKASQGGKIVDKMVHPFKDSTFDRNIIDATAHGIDCGAYHFLTGVTIAEVDEEIDFFLSCMQQHRPRIVWPLALDLEDERYTKLSKAQNTAFVRRFVNKVTAAGFHPMLYTNGAFLKYYYDAEDLADVDIWYARWYTPRSSERVPEGIPNLRIWQWGDGSVPGSAGRTDKNIGVYDYAAEKAKQDAITVGDIVEFTAEAIRYYPGGATIPSYVRTKYKHVVGATQYRKAEVVKGGKKCVLLSKKINKTNGKTLAGINTWVDVSILKKTDESLQKSEK